MRDQCRTDAERPLTTLAQLLRKSRETSARLHGSTTCRAEDIALFEAIAEKHNLFLNSAPAELSQAPTAEGNEHQVWFIKERQVFLKATWPNHFGMKVIFRRDEDPQASSIDYLDRWSLHNQIFGDDIHFLGALKTSEGLRLLIEQPAIEGTVATAAEISSFFETSGWLPFRLTGNLAFFDPTQNIVISDTHPGNIITMSNGRFAPIDLRVQRLTPSLVDSVQKLCEQNE